MGGRSKRAAHARTGAVAPTPDPRAEAAGSAPGAAQDAPGAQGQAGAEQPGGAAGEPQGAADGQGGENPSVAKSTALMSIATLGSRATGLIRTWAMAFALGNTLITSAYQVANNMPNVVYELVAGGILGAAFIPVYLLQKEKLGTQGGNRFACNILNLTVVVLGVLSIVATVFAPQVIATQTFTVGDTATVTEYAVLFFRIFAVQIVFYGIGGVVTGILNANRVYFLPSLAPALNNVVVIASFFAYVPLSAANPQLALIVLAVGTTVGVVVQFAIQIPALVKMGFRFTPKIDLHDPALKEALKIAVPTFVYIIGTMVSFSCRNAFSLQAGENGPSTLIYAWTWYQLPHGVVAVSLSRALFTEMSEAVARGDWSALRAHVRTGIAGTLLLIIPLAGLMGGLATPLMQLFQAGAFSAQDVAYVATVLALWVVSMPFYSVLMYLYNVFASMRRFLVFAVVSCIMVAVQCALYAALCVPGALGIAGVPVADFVYYGGCCVIMIVILRKRIGRFGMGSVLWMAVRVLAATLVGTGVAVGLGKVVPFPGGMTGGILELVTCGVAGLVVTFGLCALFRVPEMRLVTNMMGKIGRRLHRSSGAPDGAAPSTEGQAGEDAAGKGAGEEASLSGAARQTAVKSTGPGEAEGSCAAAKADAHAAPEREEDAAWGKTGRHAAPRALPPDATGAIMARARHVQPEHPQKAAPGEGQGGSVPEPPAGAPLPPDATGAIMARARHVQQDRHRNASPDEGGRAEGRQTGTTLPPDATGAIMARARHVR